MSNAILCPLTTKQAVDKYFIASRFQLLEIASFLDRLERCIDSENASPDFRVAAFKQAAQILNDEKSEKVRRIQELFSDKTLEPIAAAHTQGACGAVKL